MLQEVPGRRGRRIALIGIGSLIIVIILIILLIMIIIYIARHTRFRIPIETGYYTAIIFLIVLSFMNNFDQFILSTEMSKSTSIIIITLVKIHPRSLNSKELR